MHIMSALVPALVTGIVFYAIYAIIELYVRRKERMAIIEKFSEGMNPNSLDVNLKSFREKEFTSWAIRIGCLLVGVGLGVLIVSIVDLSLMGGIHSEWQRGFSRTIETMYVASTALFGGIGLVVSYFLERKYYDKKDKDEKNERE